MDENLHLGMDWKWLEEENEEKEEHDAHPYVQYFHIF